MAERTPPDDTTEGYTDKRESSMKQVKLAGLIVHQGPDELANEYAAGLIRQISDDPRTTALAAAVARGERETTPIDWDTVLVIEDAPNAEDPGPWTLAPTNVWQTCLSQLGMIESAVRGWLNGEHSPAEAMELVREQIGDL